MSRLYGRLVQCTLSNWFNFRFLLVTALHWLHTPDQTHCLVLNAPILNSMQAWNHHAEIIILWYHLHFFDQIHPSDTSTIESANKPRVFWYPLFSYPKSQITQNLLFWSLPFFSPDFCISQWSRGDTLTSKVVPWNRYWSAGIICEVCRCSYLALPQKVRPFIFAFR